MRVVAVKTAEQQSRRRLKDDARADPDVRRLQTAPGIGPLSAMATEAFAPPLEGFRRGRDFAAWPGLVPLQRSTGGRQRLGRTSKMGQRDIHRLLIIGAMTRVRWAVRNGAPAGSWLARMLARKPRRLVAIALANKTARPVWAMMTRQEDFGDPVAAAEDVRGATPSKGRRSTGSGSGGPGLPRELRARGVDGDPARASP